MTTIGATAPANPSTGDLWWDNSGTTAVLKRWDGTAWTEPPVYVSSLFRDDRNESVQFRLVVEGVEQEALTFAFMTAAERAALANANYAASTGPEVAVGTAGSRVTPLALARGLMNAIESEVAARWGALAETTITTLAAVGADSDITASDTATLNDGDAIYRSAAWSIRPPGDWRGGFDISAKDTTASPAVYRRFAVGLIGAVPTLFFRDGATWSEVEPTDRPDLLLSHWFGASTDGWGLLDVRTSPNSADPGVSNGGMWIAKQIDDAVVMLAPHWDSSATGDARYGAFKAKRERRNVPAPFAVRGSTTPIDKPALPGDTLYRPTLVRRPSAATGAYDPVTLLPTSFTGIEIGDTRTVFDDGQVMTFMAVADASDATAPTRWQLIAGTTAPLVNSNFNLTANAMSTGLVLSKTYPWHLVSVGTMPNIGWPFANILRFNTETVLGLTANAVGTSLRSTRDSVMQLNIPVSSATTRTLLLARTANNTLVVAAGRDDQDDPTPLIIRGAP